jgi:1,4-dihydroxy-2-naphthoate polyprenyltransferase
MALNIAFWGKALQTIPRVTREEWDELDVISRWLVATRSGVLIMTAISAMLGGLLAFAGGSFNTVNFIVAFFGLLLAHASNNLLNDWTDHRRGVDKDNYFRAQYGPHILEHGYITPKRFTTYILVTLLLAVACGAYLALTGPITVLYLGLAGLFFLLFYTWPLKYIGLGEPTVVLVWGPLMIGGTYFLTSGYHWSWDVVWISVLYAIGPTSVIFGKHIDKLKQDRAKKIFTLPVILGENTSRITTLAMWVLQYAGFAWLVIDGKLTWPVLVIVLAIPYLLKKGRPFLKKRPETKPDEYEAEAWPLYFVRYAFEYNKRFSLLFLLGIILHVVLTKLS